ncbi:uncharacterized protein [Ptychodera flava]
MDLRTSYYKDVDAAIVVVDLSDIESVELAGSWKQDIVNHAVVSQKKTVKDENGVVKVVTEYAKADPKSIPVLLLGNKYDVIEQREKAKMKKEEEKEEKSDEDIKDDDDDNDDDNVTERNKRIQFSDRVEVEQRHDENEKDEETGENRGDSKNTKATDEDDEFYKPKEVIIMEDVAEQHGFVGSVMVSAKDADGSVHTAIQSLLRHLIERKLKHRALEKMELKQKQKLRRKKRVKPKVEDDFEHFEEVDIPELDELFHKCNLPVKKAHDCRDGYSEALKKFKIACASADVAVTPSSSIEDCISGLKDIIGDELELMAVDDNGFLQLVVKGESKFNQPVRKALKTFHSEVVTACKTILRDCPRIDNILLDLDEKISNTAEKSWELAVQYNKTHKDVKNIILTVDKNRARIKNARTTVSQSLQDVDNTYKKVKAAIMWSQKVDFYASY